MDFLGTLGSFLTSPVGKQLLGGLAGGVLGNAFAPKGPSAAVLNAATIPAMQQRANLLEARLRGAQGARGGAGSAKALEQVLLNQQLAQGIAQQQAANQAKAYNYDRQRIADIISMAINGAGLFAPPKVATKKEDNNASA